MVNFKEIIQKGENKLRRKPILALCTISLVFLLVFPVVIQAQACHRPWSRPSRRFDAIVSTDWLAKTMKQGRTKNLVILDVRYSPDPTVEIEDFINAIKVYTLFAYTFLK